MREAKASLTARVNKHFGASGQLHALTRRAVVTCLYWIHKFLYYIQTNQNVHVFAWMCMYLILLWTVSCLYWACTMSVFLEQIHVSCLYLVCILSVLYLYLACILSVLFLNSAPVSAPPPAVSAPVFCAGFCAIASPSARMFPWMPIYIHIYPYISNIFMSIHTCPQGPSSQMNTPWYTSISWDILVQARYMLVYIQVYTSISYDIQAYPSIQCILDQSTMLSRKMTVYWNIPWYTSICWYIRVQARYILVHTVIWNIIVHHRRLGT